MLVLTGKEGEKFVGDNGGFVVTIVEVGAGRIKLGFEGQHADGSLITFDREIVHNAKQAEAKNGGGSVNDSPAPPLKL